MFQWLFDRFPRSERLRRHAPHLEALALHGPFQPAPTIANDALVYQQAPWIYLAINRIAEAAALVPLEVRRLQAGREELDGAHPLLALLAAPNPTLSRFELMEQTVGMLELTGNAYWLLLGDAGGAPREIWPLSPRHVRIVPHPQRHIAGYLYELGGETLALDAREVVHFKRWHPGDTLYGLSPVAAARQAIRTAYPVLSINEIREQFYQLPPVAWGKRPVGQAAADEDEMGAEPTQRTAGPAAGPEKGAALEELRQWERFVKRRGAKAGGRPFASRELPAAVACEVSARLLLAEDAAAQKQIFAEARQMLA